MGKVTVEEFQEEDNEWMIDSKKIKYRMLLSRIGIGIGIGIGVGV